jgi:hypothetical protein
MLISGTASAALYDLKTDWSDTNNPNGPWTYRQGVTTLGLVGDWAFAAVQPAWADAIVGSPGHIPTWLRLTADGTPDAVDGLAGDILGHSQDDFSGVGKGLASVLWTSPEGGLLSINGHAWIARDINRAVEVDILLNGVLVRNALLFHGDPYNRSTPCDIATCFGGSGSIAGVPINPGDTVELQLVTGVFGANPPVGDLVGVNLTLNVDPVAVIPEPQSYALFGGGIGLLFALKRIVRPA